MNLAVVHLWKWSADGTSSFPIHSDIRRPFLFVHQLAWRKQEDTWGVLCVSVCTQLLGKSGNRPESYPFMQGNHLHHPWPAGTEPSGGDKEVSIPPSAAAIRLSAQEIASTALRLCGQRTPREQTRPLGGANNVSGLQREGSQNTSISTEMFSPHQSRWCFCLFFYQSINVTVNTNTNMGGRRDDKVIQQDRGWKLKLAGSIGLCTTDTLQDHGVCTQHTSHIQFSSSL